MPLPKDPIAETETEEHFAQAMIPTLGRSPSTTGIDSTIYEVEIHTHRDDSLPKEETDSHRIGPNTRRPIDLNPENQTPKEPPPKDTHPTHRIAKAHSLRESINQSESPL